MGQTSGGVTVLLVPDAGGESRRVHLSRKGLRWLLFGGGAFCLFLMIMAVSWWYMAFEAWRGWQKEALLDSLEAERAQILALARELDRVEREYAHLRSLFGPEADPVAPDLWLPPVAPSRGTAETDLASADETIPSAWPLPEAGYVTQALVEGATENHPGLDIAVASGTYVRAAGAGRVLRTGNDQIYGNFIVLDHGQGYQTVYAHASMILVERGRRVRRGEVIALSGTSGRSTAPHLHFEVLRDGSPVDPLTLVQQPG